MSGAEEQVYKLLTDNAAVVALVDTRVYPLVLRQADKLPAIVYQRISTVPFNSLAGDSGASVARIQVDAYGLTYKSADAVADAVRVAFKTSATFQGRRDLSDPERGLYRLSQDFNIFEEV